MAPHGLQAGWSSWHGLPAAPPAHPGVRTLPPETGCCNRPPLLKQGGPPHPRLPSPRLVQHASDRPDCSFSTPTSAPQRPPTPQEPPLSPPKHPLPLPPPLPSARALSAPSPLPHLSSCVSDPFLTNSVMMPATASWPAAPSTTMPYMRMMLGWLRRARTSASRLKDSLYLAKRSR